MSFNAGGMGSSSVSWMGGGAGMELDEEGTRSGHINQQELHDLGGADHQSLFNMDHFD